MVSVSLLCLVAGCGGGDGPARVAAEGKVLVDGQPLQKGSVVFVPAEGTEGPKAAAEVVEGEYEFDRSNGPVVGKLRVQIEAAQDLGFDLDDPQQFTAYAEKQPGPKVPPPNPIPAKYNTNTTLTVETTEDGPNEFDFQVSTTDQ